MSKIKKRKLVETVPPDNRTSKQRRDDEYAFRVRAVKYGARWW